MLLLAVSTKLRWSIGCPTENKAWGAPISESVLAALNFLLTIIIIIYSIGIKNADPGNALTSDDLAPAKNEK